MERDGGMHGHDGTHDNDGMASTSSAGSSADAAMDGNGPTPASTTTSAAAGDHNMGMGHQMSPFLFIRTTGFFVLFKEANIQSTGAFVGALILSFFFAVLSTLLSQVIRSIEERGLSTSKPLVKIVTGIQHAFRTFLHYVAMLIVMTMNVWLILAVVAGHALGWIVYALALHPRLKSAANKPACDC